MAWISGNDVLRNLNHSQYFKSGFESTDFAKIQHCIVSDLFDLRKNDLYIGTGQILDLVLS